MAAVTAAPGAAQALKKRVLKLMWENAFFIFCCLVIVHLVRKDELSLLQLVMSVYT